MKKYLSLIIEILFAISVIVMYIDFSNIKLIDILVISLAPISIVLKFLEIKKGE